MLIIGAARQGTALANYMINKGASVTLNDKRPAKSILDAQTMLSELPINWELGGHPITLLEGIHTVFPSGGVPLEIAIITEAVKRGIPLSNDSEIFLEETPCKVIGITGSAGKTTTATLVGQIAQAAINAHSHSSYRKVWVGGNIGLPLIEHVDEMQADDLAVMELSSFQLELMTRSPQVAAFLNLTPNHLDRHTTMEAYTQAKANILKYQTKTDVAILNREDSSAWAMAESVIGRLFTFGRGELAKDQLGTFVRANSIWLRNEEGEIEVMPLESIQLLGEHNLQNVLAACAITAVVGLPVEAMRTAVSEFTGVAHRLEFIRQWGGADWYNDSIATAPERSIAALKSFDREIILLAGGQDKDLPWDKFATEVRARVEHLVVFGEAAQTVLDALGQPTAEQEGGFTITHCDGLLEATKRAAELVEPGDVVLLSPGGASFDEFKDFEERGKKFIEWVQAL